MQTDIDTTQNLPIVQAMHLIKLAAQAETPLARKGRLVNGDVLLGIGDQTWRMSIQAGQVIELSAGPFVMPASRFRLAAPAAEWQLFWRPVPPPGSHDLFALLKRGVLGLDGDLQPFMSHLLYFKQLLAAPRSRVQQL